MKRIIAAISSASLAILICFGAMLLWAGLVQVGTKAASTLAGSTSAYVYHTIQHDGEIGPLVYTSKREYGSATVGTYTDLNGQPRKEPDLDKPDLGSGIVIETSAPRSRNNPSRASLLAHAVSPTEIWFFVHDGNPSGGCWLECYTPGIPGRTICLGTAGSTEKTPDLEHRFDVDLISWKFRKPTGGIQNSLLKYGSRDTPGIKLLAAKDGIRLIDLQNRSCKLIAPLPQGFEGIYGGRRARVDDPTTRRNRRFDPLDWNIIVRTSDTLIRMDLDGSNVVKMELPEDIRNQKVDYCEMHDGSPYLHASMEVPVFDKTSVRGAIFDVNSSGELSNRRDYAWLNSRRALSETADSLSLGMAMPAPLFTGGAAVFSAATGAPWSPTQNTLRLFPAIVSGLIAVWFSLQFQKKQPHPYQILWLVFVACLGVFGYIGYRYHRRWPPAAFLTMTVDSFVAPAANGLEVFA